ncbi:MAG TPA: helix-turn-helix domain-containing protein [Trebonia sp.]
MTEPSRPLRADARRNREKVVRAAREAFAAHGYGVPLDEIAALAGVGPGTVYRHFPSKEALFEAVVAARISDLVTDGQRRARDEDPASAFFGFLGRIGEEAAAKRDLPDALDVPGSLRDEIFGTLDTLLRRAQQAGAIRADVTTPDLIVLLKGLIRSLQDTPPGDTGEDQRGRLLSVVTEGLRHAGGGAGRNAGAGDTGESALA